MMIMKHKYYVCRFCFRIGLYCQGLCHDLSKFSPTEFSVGMKYFKGTESPNNSERRERGVSRSWLHHKGRNKHHFEYWIDYDLEHPGMVTGMRMPYRYVAEMFCDRVAASKVYNRERYQDEYPWIYFARMKDSPMIHETTKRELMELLLLLKEEGEEKTFRYLKRELKRRKRAGEYYD